jgi:hypothetical protein
MGRTRALFDVEPQGGQASDGTARVGGMQHTVERCDGRTMQQVQWGHAPDGIGGTVQNRAAACSARGERTPFDRVM